MNLSTSTQRMYEKALRVTGGHLRMDAGSVFCGQNVDVSKLPAAVARPVNFVNDIQPILEQALTFRHNGIDRRLTDVHGHVVREILA